MFDREGFFTISHQRCYKQITSRCSYLVDNSEEYVNHVIDLSEKLYNLDPDLIPTKLYSYYAQAQDKCYTFLKFIKPHYISKQEFEEIYTYLANSSDQMYQYLEGLNQAYSYKFTFFKFILPYIYFSNQIQNSLQMKIADYYNNIDHNAWDFVDTVHKLMKFLAEKSKLYKQRVTENGLDNTLSNDLIRYVTNFQPLALGSFLTTKDEWKKCLEFAVSIEELIHKYPTKIPEVFHTTRNRSTHIDPCISTYKILHCYNVNSIAELKQFLKLD
ncbi:hypothetical protein TVAG_086140 [Trichomonas vaginalis G3]|uniref:Uncharacterized protein n=1 Tax=Trichomonas vaginalis (strain ATCC PRA-98 / G3) TaxID=412133 RepID=A2FDC4_TRIV3|nr:hypothetical protein TVAGG3_0525600 [Trichomonas vaginalis G3]EAX97075.1 hypothetical protein TVAG_086140 [Trichomonas vaginalis G3]KAI5518740.1 hypothetical protein TVAGG3_0525600 [Trichomonas vaginalis G3]|eukprot:XP_001310005.1 hypothetical protein [Trichomonas vaginalis G3]